MKSDLLSTTQAQDRPREGLIHTRKLADEGRGQGPRFPRARPGVSTLRSPGRHRGSRGFSMGLIPDSELETPHFQMTEAPGFPPKAACADQGSIRRGRENRRKNAPPPCLNSILRKKNRLSFLCQGKTGRDFGRPSGAPDLRNLRSPKGFFKTKKRSHHHGPPHDILFFADRGPHPAPGKGVPAQIAV